MKTALILHGICDEHEYYEMDFPSPSNAHWIPWLQQKFLRDGRLCQALEMPTPPTPNYQEWCNVFNQVKIQQDTIIVAHSAGCGFILKWMTAHPEVSFSLLVLVAPWLDPLKTRGSFLDFALDSSLTQRVEKIHVLYSPDDPTEGVKESKDEIIQTLPKAKLHLFQNKGHFCLSTLGSPAFEELWAICNTSP
ncbi:MAG: alpha/beta hydrolase [Alphaproteobacteria bacterium]|nr:alpha/beta hydrolase [Alphaproteobacteria bacterium]